MSEEKNMLPHGWEKTNLDNLIIKMSNGANVTQYEEKIGLPISRIETIWDGNIDLDRVKYIVENCEEFVLKYKLNDGDILFSHINSDIHLGKTAIFKSQVECLIHGINLLLIRPSIEIPSAFMNYQFQFMRHKGEFMAVAQRAVNQSSINQKKLKSFEIVVPPIDEQHRIVAKIEELFSELDNGIESLKTAREQLKVYRQAVLKHAFEGKLTAGWRAQNKDKLETAEQLHARIKTEREAQYQQQQTDWEAATKMWEVDDKQGKKPARPKLPKSFTHFSTEEVSTLHELPLGWAWGKVASLFEVVSGGTPKGIEQALGNDIPFYKISDMNAPGNERKMWKAAINLSKAEKDKLSLTEYPEGTVIFPKRGGAILTNKKRVLSRSSCFDLNTMGFVNRIASVSNDYLWHWFQALDLAKIYDGSNVPQINNKNVEPLAFPLCAIEEQEEISNILERHLSIIDTNTNEIDRNLSKSKALRQSILKKAFSGQLIAQDQNDEHAAALLERIKSEKVAKTPPTKIKRKKNV